MKPVVYVDVLFMLNFTINLALLWTTAKITRQKLAPWRLLAGGILSAFYAVVMFFPYFHLYYTLLAKLVFSALLMAVSFKIDRWKVFFYLLACFYMVTFTFGGAALALFYFTDVGVYLGALLSNGVIYMNIPIKLLVVSSIGAYVLISIGWHVYRKIVRPKSLVCALKLSVEEKSVTVDALLDTGNALYDPLSGDPVVVAEYEAIHELLPHELENVFLSHQNDLSILSKISLDGWRNRLRLIPFSSLGQENGLLIGFKPDAATLDGQELGNIVVAVYLKALSKEKNYFALLHPEILVKQQEANV